MSLEPKRLIGSKLVVFALLATLSAAGCNTRDVDSAWPAPRPLGRDIGAFRPGPESMEQETDTLGIDEPTTELALHQALALALARNPELASASWEVRAAEARALQAGAIPNPEVRIQMGDFGGTGRFEGTKESDQSIRLSQVFELGGKASGRRRCARLDAALRGWDYETMRLEVFAETTKAFVAVLAAQERLVAARQMHKQAEFVMSSVSRRVATGMGTHLEAHEARIALGNSQIDLDRATRALAAKRGVLASYWDAEQPKFQQAVGEFDNLAANGLPSLEQLLEHIAINPDLARWETEARMRQAEIDLERADAIPDVRALFTTQRLEETGAQGYTVALEMSLPLFDRNKSGIREARLNRVKAASEHRAAVMVAAAALREAHQMLATGHQEASVLKNVSLPAAQDAADSVREVLKAGLVTDLEFLKAQRTLFKEKTKYVDALETYHIAAADVERLIAQPISAVGSQDRSQAVSDKGEDAGPDGVE